MTIPKLAPPEVLRLLKGATVEDPVSTKELEHASKMKGSQLSELMLKLMRESLATRIRIATYIRGPKL